MKKQLLILAAFIVVMISLLVLTNQSNSNSKNLFETSESFVSAEDQANKDYGEAVQIKTDDFELNLDGRVFVDVQGEVINPGVFEVDRDVRIGYLIELAGGLTDDANTRALNQAARIYDEMVIFVPHINDLSEGDVVESPTVAPGGVDAPGLISLNEATALELQSLPGIGPTLSANIIEYRETNGSFSAIDELINVAGIGARTLEHIREFIRP